MHTLTVYAFSPGWGLPSMGPFALKLVSWLDHHQIDYVMAYENNPAKGPLGKSPWIVHGTHRLGDTEQILTYLRQVLVVQEVPLEGPRGAAARAWQIAFEERFHQILEWELFAHDAGFAHMREVVRQGSPPMLGALIAGQMRRHFRRQLHARGIARLSQATITALGQAMLTEFCTWLEQRAFALGEQPCVVDFAVYGQVAPLLHWPMSTPVADYAKSLEPLRAWAERVRPSQALPSRQEPNQGDSDSMSRLRTAA